MPVINNDEVRVSIDLERKILERTFFEMSAALFQSGTIVKNSLLRGTSVDRAINCGAHLEMYRVRPCTALCHLEPSPTFPGVSNQVATQNQNLLRARVGL